MTNEPADSRAGRDVRAAVEWVC